VWMVEEVAIQRDDRWRRHNCEQGRCRAEHTGTDDLDFNGLLSRLVEATLLVLWGLDGGGEESVDEGGLAESRLT